MFVLEASLDGVSNSIKGKEVFGHFPHYFGFVKK